MAAAAVTTCRSPSRSIVTAGFLVGLSLTLAACGGGRSIPGPGAIPSPVPSRARPVPAPPEMPPETPGSPAVTRVPVASLKGWSSEDHRAALAAFRVGCRAARSETLRRTCRSADGVASQDDTSARLFFERHFQAEVLPGEGVLTGYFAPVYPASRRRSGPFTAPVRPPPPPGQLIDAGMIVAQTPSGPSAPQRPAPAADPPDTVRRELTALPPGSVTPAAPPPAHPAPTVSASLDLAALDRPSSDPVADLLDGPSASAGVPVPTAPPASLPTPVDPAPAGPPAVAIQDDAPPPRIRVRMRDADRATLDQAPTEGVTAWMRPEDLFFMQIQGSGILVFPDGERARAAYAGDNGKPFVGIARPMIRDGLLPATGASGDGIRRWLAAHAGDEADAVMRKNPRYVFFRLGADTGAEPQGAAGISLPAGRAIAMDSRHHDFGTLYWIDAEAPTLSGAASEYHRLAVDLDTGGAIRGPIRADLYFGTGEAAGREAGRVKHVLHLARLVPVDGDGSEERDAAAASPRGR